MRTPGRGAGPGDATAGDRGPRSPSFLARWWSRSIAAIGSDLALHGLAYLGVLLLFVGSFGLVAFAFGDVSGSLRPIAEVALVVAPFAAARMLLRRGAVVAGRALELAGGLILPIMVITSLLDGFGLPPDLTGAPLVVTLTGAVGALSVGYAWWSSRHPDSALRYLVAPTAWVAAALAGMGIGREIPSGSGVASVTAAQIGLVAAGMTVSAALARWRPASLLAGPTVTACVVGAPIVGLVAVLSWLAESYPAAPIAVTGVLGLVLLELLAVRLQPTWALGAQTAWWGVVSIGLGGSPELGPAPASAIALVGFVGLLESGSARRTTPTLLVLPAILAAVALVPTWQEPWWAVGATAATAVWAVVRRSTRAFMVALAPQAFDAAAAILPAAAVAAFWRASQDDVAALLVVAGLVLVATVPATRPLLRRTPDDPFWSGFWGVAIVLAVAAAALVTAEAYPASANRVWLLAGAVAMLTIAAGVGPVAAEARPWVVAGLGGWTWLLASDAAGLSADVRAVVVAGVGVVLVGVGHGVARQTLWQGCCVSPEGESELWEDPHRFLLRRRPGSC